MRGQVQTHNKAATHTTPMPAVSAFQTRPFAAQNTRDEASSFEGDGSSLFGTYLQRRAAAVGAEAGMPSVLPSQNRTGLPDQLKTGIESLSGVAMDEVRVHYNSLKPAEYQALAYTQATDIYVAPGQERHLPHEAWHVVQQMQGRVRPTMQMKGVGVNDDVGLEREATVMGGKALQMMRSNQVGTGSTSQMSTSLQRNERAASPLPVTVQREKSKGRRKDLEGDPLIVKVIIAGSSHDQWATRKNKPEPPRQDNDKDSSEVTYYRKDKDGYIELSFAGPGGKSTKESGWPGGVRDIGSNSIKNLVSQVPIIVEKTVQELVSKRDNDKPIVIMIKAHSRGAVAGSQVAKIVKCKINQAKIKNVEVEFSQFDPVPGPGHKGESVKINLIGLDESTLVYSVASGYPVGFSPQTVYGAKRIIISQQNHSAGLKAGFNYKEEIYKGSRLNSLPAGVFVDYNKNGENRIPLEFVAPTNDVFEKIDKAFKQKQAWIGDLGRIKIIENVLEAYSKSFKKPEYIYGLNEIKPYNNLGGRLVGI